jgi:hypothetical protein
MPSGKPWQGKTSFSCVLEFFNNPGGIAFLESIVSLKV